MTIKCPLCGSEVSEEKGPVRLDADGVPLAVSMVDGVGVPVMDCNPPYFDIFLDGIETQEVVAFDRERGLIWRNKHAADGQIMVRDGKVMIERVPGVVTVRMRTSL